ncbi:MAG: SDR family oxidoreductase [Capsulimonadales bacterium]|nr:SDR family oxidoreductase [Capsulimonadales bacterium]
MAATRSNVPSLAWITLGAITVGWAAADLVRRQYRMDFSGKVALITGGSRGLGLLLARLLTEEGASVALCARDFQELEIARIDLEARGVSPDRILIRTCDVTDNDQVKEMTEATLARFGRIDILINNAGTIQVGPNEVQTDEDFETAMAVHFWGPHHFVRAALPSLKKTHGRIVNISSIGGLVAFPHLLPYSTSKAALIAYSQGLRAELARDGIRVTTVAPGLMRTGSPPNALFKGDHSSEYAWFVLADSLPGSSQSADKAASLIINALRFGDAFLVTSAAGKAGAFVSGLFPGLTADLLTLADRFLPTADPGQPDDLRAVPGRESESPITRSLLTMLTRRAARNNNQTRTKPVEG